MKKFTTYEEQIELLKSRDLDILNENNLCSYLKNYGYYNLINGYSFVFKYKNNNVYRNKVNEEDIMSLYKFDKNLRNIVYKYTLNIESKIKSLISYVFSREHGEHQDVYLQRECFDKDRNKDEQISKLINKCQEIIAVASDKNSNKFRKYIMHYVDEHKHVPFWVLIRAMTIGETSKFYSCMTLKERSEISKEFQLNPKKFEIMLKMLVAYRNIVAHDERIFCVQIQNDSMPVSLNVYEYMKIKKTKNGVPMVGKKDFLALMIIMKYLLSEMEFANFWFELNTELCLLKDKLKDKINYYGEIIEMMGLKNSWYKLRSFNPLIN